MHRVIFSCQGAIVVHRNTFRVSISPGSISEGKRESIRGEIQLPAKPRKRRIADGFGHALKPLFVFDVSPPPHLADVAFPSDRSQLEIVHPCRISNSNRTNRLHGFFECISFSVYLFVEMILMASEHFFLSFLFFFSCRTLDISGSFDIKIFSEFLDKMCH